MGKKKTETIDHGLILMQPWADEIVQGNLPCLIRSFNTNRREKVYVLVSGGLDKNDFEKIINSDKVVEYYQSIGHAIGAVTIKDSKKVQIDAVEKVFINLFGKSKWEAYPKHFIPVGKKDHVYFWIFEDQEKWDEMIKVEGKHGITWSTYKLIKK